MAALIVFQKVANDPPFGMERVNMVALTIVLTTRSQKPSRASSTSGGSRRGMRRGINSNLMQVSLETQKFAGRLMHFVSAWMSITAD